MHKDIEEFGLKVCKCNIQEDAVSYLLKTQSAGWRINLNSPGRKPGVGNDLDPDNAGGVEYAAGMQFRKWLKSFSFYGKRD